MKTPQELIDMPGYGKAHTVLANQRQFKDPWQQLYENMRDSLTGNFYRCKETSQFDFKKETL